MFKLDQRLRDDTYLVGRFELSLLLLSRDVNYPWCILVPQREDTYELYHLSDADQVQLMRESTRLAEVMDSVFDADKINVAALGNQVAQLHVHHVARFKDDPAWPGPIWGACEPVGYEPQTLEHRIGKLTNALAGESFTPIDAGEMYESDQPASPKIDC